MAGPFGLLRKKPPTAASELQTCFPRQLCLQQAKASKQMLGGYGCHQLTTSGSRSFGLFSPKLKIKIYDFAIYMDAKQVAVQQAALYFKPSRTASPCA
jgi:hypothetical protein